MGHVFPDPPSRTKSELIEDWLDEADKGGSYATKVDRHLGLRTFREDVEYRNHWKTERNKVYICFAVLAFVISLVSLAVAIISYVKSS